MLIPKDHDLKSKITLLKMITDSGFSANYASD